MRDTVHIVLEDMSPKLRVWLKLLGIFLLHPLSHTGLFSQKESD